MNNSQHEEIVGLISQEMTDMWERAAKVRTRLAEPSIESEIFALEAQAKQLTSLLDKYDELRLDSLPSETIIVARAACDAVWLITSGYRSLQRLT